MNTSPFHKPSIAEWRNGDTSTHNGNAGDPKIFVSDDALLAPKISVIVPALNEEKLIGGMLCSFPADELDKSGIELVVSDGGSTDRTVEIARKYADVVVQHTQKRRQTIAEGRNLGAWHARGDLLVFINADTMPQDPLAFLRALGNLAAEGRSNVVAFACPVSIGPEERKWSDTIFHTFFNNYVRFLNLVGLGMGRGECQVVWREDFMQVKGYQEHMAAGEDFDLYRRLASRGRIGERKGLHVYESPRRFRRFGYLRILFEWTLNAVAVMVLGRSISKEWEEIR